MNMTVEMYEQAVHRAMKEVALSHLHTTGRPLSEKLPVEKPIRS